MSMSRILCVTNRKLCREDFFDRIEKIAAGNPAGIILREKDLSPEEYKVLALRVREICQKHKVPCIFHTFWEIALELSHEAIHVPLPVLREMPAGERVGFTTLGASCHSVAEAKEAEELSCTYITAGHIFETDCKKGLPGRGTDFLQEVCREVSIPVFAIGGIEPGNISKVREAGAFGACLMSSLMVEKDPGKLLLTMEKKYEV